MTEVPLTRDLTVAVFVVADGKVLLHRHQKLNRWLPPGGHVEPNELPDDAAIREVLEETGVIAQLIGPSSIDVDLPEQPRQLVRPAGVQLAQIRPGHEHIDLVYLATAIESRRDLESGCGWFGSDDWAELDLTEEVAAWCRHAIDTLT